MSTARKPVRHKRASERPVQEKRVPGVPKAELLSDEEIEALSNPAPKKANDLLKQEFPELDWIVPGVIPDGCHLLIAAPKIGKSMLTLGVAIACATGRKVLGVVKVRKRPVLLLDLESGERRLQSRLKTLGVRTLPDTFEFHTDPDTALNVLRSFLDKHKGESPLVILDTLSGVMGSRPRDMTQFQHEKRTLQPLQTLCAEDPGASIIVVHHNRKAKEGDSVDASSGTHGLTAAVDGILALNRPSRRNPEATLICELRDIEGDEYAILLGARGWVFDGASVLEARINAIEHHRQEKVAKQGDLNSELMDLLRTNGPITPAEAYDVYQRDPKAAASKQSVRNALSRLRSRGLVSKDAKGHYALNTPPELPELRVAKQSPDVSSPDFDDVRGNSNSPNSGGKAKHAGAQRRRKAGPA